MPAYSLARAVSTATLLLLAAGAAFPTDAVQNVATGAAPSDAGLTADASYLLGAPLWRPLDTIALLGLSQHIAVVLTVLLALATWRMLRGFRTVDVQGRWGTGWVVAWVLTALVGIYAAAALLPHPTTQLAVTDPDVLRVDFHSHTGHSRDAADRYSVEWNRRWHRRTGFDAAFVTDHSSWAAIPSAASSNPTRAGEDLVLMSGTEAWFNGDHAVALGDSTRYLPVFDPERWRFEPDSLRAQRTAAPATLVIVLPLRDPSRVTGWSPTNPAGAVAIEISDGSPKGLEQGRRDRRLLLDLAEEHNLALVSGSNTHGTGQVAAAWTLLRIPGWRALDPEGLERQIRILLHSERGDATRVVERTLPHPSSTAGLAWTIPAVVWHGFRTMGWSERLVWLMYAGFLLLAFGRREGLGPL